MVSSTRGSGTNDRHHGENLGRGHPAPAAQGILVLFQPEPRRGDRAGGLCPAGSGRGAYPGSPWFALEGMRDIDKATIFEMQKDVFQQLYFNIRDRRAGLHERDAYEGLLGVIPPPEKRGLVMIDPPYELERKDFPQLVELLSVAHKKWPTGVFAVWYPIKDRAMIDRFEKKMMRTGIRRQLVCEICVWPDDTPVGLNGCALLVINPPWKFSEDADEALQWLFPHLRMSENGGHAAVRWLVGE